MNTCKTCQHWQKPTNYRAESLCEPLDPDTNEPMARGFEIRECVHPAKTFHESPVERDGFGITDASNYFAALVTAEDFGCIRHEPDQDTGTTQ